MSDGTDEDLEVLTTYPSAVEAGFARQLLADAGIDSRLDGEAAATNLSYVGTAVGGCRVLVREVDLRAAAEILADEESLSEEDLLARGEAEGWWEDDEPDSAAEAAAYEPSPELKRAYHTAIIGLVMFPFGVPLYSLYLIVRHRLFLPDRGGNNWRFLVAMLADTVGLYLTKLFWTGWI